MQSISRIFRAHGQTQEPLSKRVTAALAVESATKILQNLFPGALPSIVNPQFVKNKVLTIACKSGAVAQEISLQKQKIIKLLNNELGGELVVDIRVSPWSSPEAGLPN